MSVASLLRTGCTTNLSRRRGLLECRCLLAAIVHVPARGKKMKFGGITRDPYRSLKNKIAQAKAMETNKTPLMSRERKDRSLLYPFTVTSIGEFIVKYVPLEKFAKAPIYTAAGRSQRWTAFKEFLQTIYGGAIVRRRLRKVDPFKPMEFAQWAQESFIAVNQAITVKKDKTTLRKLTTENASSVLKEEFKNKHVMWKYLENVERPRVVSARVAPYLSKDNLFGQVVVRMHTKQIMTIHDFAGRLEQGDPIVPRKVIDYVVFERYLTPEKGKLVKSSWRICGKLPPQVPWEVTKRNALNQPSQPAIASSS